MSFHPSVTVLLWLRVDFSFKSPLRPPLFSGKMALVAFLELEIIAVISAFLKSN